MSDPSDEQSRQPTEEQINAQKEIMLKQSFSDKIEVGCDEAGRGCLAGPVVAAAVLLPSHFNNKTLNDSSIFC